MSKEKISKLEVKSYREDLAKFSQDNKTLISFDVYFQKLLVKGKNVFPHHKAPMLKYAESKGFLKASEEQFDEIFKDY
jgi:hypothetical protein